MDHDGVRNLNSRWLGQIDVQVFRLAGFDHLRDLQVQMPVSSRHQLTLEVRHHQGQGLDQLHLQESLRVLRCTFCWRCLSPWLPRVPQNESAGCDKGRS